MTSGIPDFDTAKPWPPPPKDPLRATIYANPSEDYTPASLIDVPWVYKGALDFTPGTKQRYSSTNFMLLGLVLAHFAEAKQWDAYDQKSFLPPAVARTLPSVKYVQHGAPSDHSRVHGYDRTSYNGHNSKALPGTDVHAVHGVFGGWTASDYTSTVADAARFAHAVYGKERAILDAEHVAIMIPTSPFYGFATFNLTGQTGQAPENGGTAYGHIGATYGYQSMLLYNPDMDVSIAIASNMENDDQTHPSDTLCSAFNAVRNAVTGATDDCVYKKGGYYGGECKCQKSGVGGGVEE